MNFKFLIDCVIKGRNGEADLWIRKDTEIEVTECHSYTDRVYAVAMIEIPRLTAQTVLIPIEALNFSAKRI